MDIDDIKRYRGDIFASEYLDRIAAVEAELADCKAKLAAMLRDKPKD